MSAGPAPTASPTGPPVASPPGYVVPSLGWRILAGGLRLIGLMVLLIGLPVALLTFLSTHGIEPPVPIRLVEYAGIAITLLVTLRYILKPTAAYGPLAIATAGVGLLYLYLILVNAVYVIAVGSVGLSISIDYARLILLLMIGPVLALGAGILIAIEDARAPQERLPFDYPA